MRRVIVLILSAGTLATLYVASAAALGAISGGDLGAGDAPIVACDATGFTLAYATTAGEVTAATVNGVADPGCEGGELSVTLTNADGAAIAAGGPEEVVADGDTGEDSVVVALTPTPAAEQVSGYHISLVGP